MYIVTRESTNGYRCSCCVSYFDDTDWYDELEDALFEVPTTNTGTADHELLEVEVKNGEDGEVVAWGKMRWSSGYGKYSGYRFTCWSGYRPDTGEFEHITDKQGNVVEGKTWKQVLAELAAEKAQKDYDDAKRKFEAAQQELNRTAKALEAL
jgi:hypothetical protein